MALDASKAAFKTALLTLSTNTDPELTPEQAVDNVVEAMETWIKTATVTLNPLGLVAPPGGGPVTGTASSTLT